VSRSFDIFEKVASQNALWLEVGVEAMWPFPVESSDMNEHCFGDAAQWPKPSLVRPIVLEPTASRMASELICTYAYVYLKEKQEERLQKRGIDTNILKMLQSLRMQGTYPQAG
jgi:hypothetical protein